MNTDDLVDPNSRDGAVTGFLFKKLEQGFDVARRTGVRRGRRPSAVRDHLSADCDVRSQSRQLTAAGHLGQRHRQVRLSDQARDALGYHSLSAGNVDDLAKCRSKLEPRSIATHEFGISISPDKGRSVGQTAY
jgi:hypothetical protein